jgi:hypothetical protein
VGVATATGGSASWNPGIITASSFAPTTVAAGSLNLYTAVSTGATSTSQAATGQASPVTTVVSSASVLVESV